MLIRLKNPLCRVSTNSSGFLAFTARTPCVPPVKNEPGVFFLILLHECGAVNRLYSRFFQLCLFLLLLITFPNKAWDAEPRVQIRSPKDGSQITQEQAYVLIGGKAAVETGGSGSVDIFLLLDVSGSTAQYSGAEFAEFSQLPNWYVNRSRLGGRGLPCAGPERPGPLNLR